MQLSNQSIVIIGSGMAAYILAQNIRQECRASKITIITNKDGRFYPKPMLSTALYHQKSPEDIVTSSAQEMADKYKINVITRQEVQAINPHKKEIVLTDQVIEYDKLVLAVGAKANQIPGLKPIKGYLSINAIEDYEQLLERLKSTKRVLIIGSGLVGVEFAHDLLQAGYEVTMVSQDASALWPLIPREIGAICRDHLVSLGLDWISDKYVNKMVSHDHKLTVTFSDQSESNYDLILSAIGISPNLALAKQAGLKINRGVVTNAYGQTSDPHIFAIGDCAEAHGLVLTYVAPIKQQAQAIAKSLLGNATTITYPPMPVVVKMPTFPLTLVPVRQVNPQGKWQIVQNDEDKGFIAGFYDENQVVQGFVLAGKATRLRNEWLQKMPQSIIT